MASEKVRTGLELEIFTMGQCARVLKGIDGPMKFRILNHLILEADSDPKVNPVDDRQENLFDE